MKTPYLVGLLGLLMFSSFAQDPVVSVGKGVPATPKRPVTDTYFGKAVVDNQCWLEDMNSDETKAWFKVTSLKTSRWSSATSPIG